MERAMDSSEPKPTPSTEDKSSSQDFTSGGQQAWNFTSGQSSNSSYPSYSIPGGNQAPSASVFESSSSSFPFLDGNSSSATASGSQSAFFSTSAATSYGGSSAGSQFFNGDQTWYASIPPGFAYPTGSSGSLISQELVNAAQLQFDDGQSGLKLDGSSGKGRSRCDKLPGFMDIMSGAEEASRPRRRRGTTKKDPNRLRRPINAFLIWFHSHYKEITDGKAGLSFGEKMRLGAEIWASKPIEEKDVYEQEHQRMRQNWIDAKNRMESGEGIMHLNGGDMDESMRNEKVMNGLVEVKKRRRRAPESSKDPNRLRRPINAFLLWFHSNYKEVCEKRPGSSRAENMRVGAEIWAAKSTDEKEEYNRLRLEWLDQKTKLESGGVVDVVRKSPKDSKFVSTEPWFCIVVDALWLDQRGFRLFEIFTTVHADGNCKAREWYSALELAQDGKFEVGQQKFLAASILPKPFQIPLSAWCKVDVIKGKHGGKDYVQICNEQDKVTEAYRILTGQAHPERFPDLPAVAAAGGGVGAASGLGSGSGPIYVPAVNAGSSAALTAIVDAV